MRAVLAALVLTLGGCDAVLQADEAIPTASVDHLLDVSLERAQLRREASFLFWRGLGCPIYDAGELAALRERQNELKDKTRARLLNSRALRFDVDVMKADILIQERRGEMPIAECAMPPANSRSNVTEADRKVFEDLKSRLELIDQLAARIEAQVGG